MRAMKTRAMRFELDANFLGYGRCALDREGGFRFRTIRPGRVPGPGNTLQAPHIALGMIGPRISEAAGHARSILRTRPKMTTIQSSV